MAVLLVIAVGCAAPPQSSTESPSGSIAMTASYQDDPLPSVGPGDDYVALGDSYSSGEGLPPYAHGSDVSCLGPASLKCRITGQSPGNFCHRSNKAYSQIALRGPGEPSRTFRACSGGVLDDLIHARGFEAKDGADDGRLYNPSEPAQVVWLGSSTRYVTMSLAGNDAGFADILKQCSFRRVLRIRGEFRPSDEFVSACNKQLDIYREKLPEIASALQSSIRLVLDRAPNAQVRILNYPTIFPDPEIYRGYKNQACELGQIGGYVLNEHVARFRDLNKSLNETIRDAVRRVDSDGVRARLADVEAQFGDHSVSCGDKGRLRPWVNAALLRLGPGVSSASFHPNTTGQCQMAALINREFGWTGRPVRC